MDDDDRKAPSSPASALRLPRGPSVTNRVRAWFARLTQPTASTPLDVDAVLAWSGWTDECAVCVRRAFLEARERGHDAVEPTHLLMSLLHDASILRCLAGVEVGRVMMTLDEALGRNPWFGRPRTSDATNHAMQAAAARVQQAQRRDVLPGLLAELFASSASVRSMLEAAGFQRLQFLYAFSHGRPRTPWTDDTAPAGDPLSLVMENDDYTTQVTVVEILEGFLGHSPNDASRLMLEVHESGHATVATMKRVDAIDTVQRIARFALNEGSPLRVSLRAPTDARVVDAQ